MIKLENVTKKYPQQTDAALIDADADIAKGEFVFLVGPSGSGKSTMIRLVNKSEDPDSGRIFVAGKDIGKLSSWKVPMLRRNIGLPGFQIASHPDRSRERELRARGDRSPPSRDQVAGSCDL